MGNEIDELHSRACNKAECFALKLKLQLTAYAEEFLRQRGLEALVGVIAVAKARPAAPHRTAPQAHVYGPIRAYGARRGWKRRRARINNVMYYKSWRTAINYNIYQNSGALIL